VNPNLDDRAALHALRDASTRAHLCERRTRFGQAIWTIDSPPMRFVTKPDAGTTVVVTVLDGADGGEDDAEQEVIEAYKRIASIAPEIATPTRPRPRPDCCAGHEAAWLDTETKRLDVERRRIEAAIKIEANIVKGAEAKREAARLKMAHVQAEAQRQAEGREARIAARENAILNAGQVFEKQVRYRNGLLRDAAAKLRALDPSGCAGLLGAIDDVLRAEERKEAKRSNDRAKRT
jgi:hypothetical protein